MMRKHAMNRLALGVMLALSPALVSMPAPVVAFAAENTQQDDIEAQIAEQERILADLNNRKKQASTDAIKAEMQELQNKIDALSKKDDYDSRGAIESLSLQLSGLQQELDEQQKTQKLLMQTLEKLDKLTSNMQADGGTVVYDPDHVKYTAHVTSSTAKALVNPGPQGKVSYTQDAINAQNNSTMVFSYAPDQLYKIYCRTGYLTDIELHKGEKVSFVGGGDTSSWAINSTTVAGTPHIYIKPVVKTSTTNIIITTDKRSYQLIVNTSDWYNPMVRWTYGQEELEVSLAQQAKDDRTITSRLGVTNPENLHFKYKVTCKGDAEKPQMVFDDGEKTYIRFAKASKRLPALFIREKGHKSVSLANFKVKDNTYMLDRLIDQAELRFSDEAVVSIKREK